MPISYQFGFKTLAPSKITSSSSFGASSTTGTTTEDVSNDFVELTLRARAELNYATSTLPAGRSETGNMLNTTVTVFDALDASEVKVSQVKVTILETQALQSLIINKLTGSNTGNSSTSTVSNSLTADELIKELSF